MNTDETHMLQTDGSYRITAGKTSPPDINWFHLPPMETPNALLAACSKLGLVSVPAAIQASASASGQLLASGGIKLSVFDIDQALKRTNLGVSERIQFKRWLDRAGLIKNDR